MVTEVETTPFIVNEILSFWDGVPATVRYTCALTRVFSSSERSAHPVSNFFILIKHASKRRKGHI